MVRNTIFLHPWQNLMDLQICPWCATKRRSFLITGYKDGIYCHHVLAYKAEILHGREITDCYNNGRVYDHREVKTSNKRIYKQKQQSSWLLLCNGHCEKVQAHSGNYLGFTFTLFKS
jgi:hypothetical protein